MEKKAIDPRLVTTPIGAAIGLALTKRMVAEEDQNLLNLGAGTALGGGAGYLAGEYIRAERGPSGESKAGIYDRYLSSQDLGTLTGPPTGKERDLLREDKSVTSNVSPQPPEDKPFWAQYLQAVVAPGVLLHDKARKTVHNIRTNRMVDEVGRVENRLIYKRRMEHIKRALKSPNLSSGDKQKLENALRYNFDAYKKADSGWKEWLSFGLNLRSPDPTSKDLLESVQGTN
jgi:hypothetical protein